ncbi:MAG: hypothetical protein QME35_05170 [Thermoanaerobacteraceae bacterium]|nr:hypothetical protein [Thermoanaerobacteraceae bacterium]
MTLFTLMFAASIIPFPVIAAAAFTIRVLTFAPSAISIFESLARSPLENNLSAG